ncbi:MAG: hypothetical protein IJW40_04700 [Clostridia bacterium]|nr:hypothetical protein [Clostridia bacterium]
MTNKNIYMSLSGLDPELIMKAAPAEKVQKKKKNAWIKWASIAACLCLVVMVGVFAIPNLIGYHSCLSEDEIFERSNTYFDNYEELAAVVGNDTLLENIDFATLNDYELRLVHELDNVNNYHAVSFVNIMPEDEFGFGIHFSPYNNKIANLVDEGETVIINGVTVQYEKRGTDGSTYKYNFAAEFEYNDCYYQILSMGNSDESVFWDNLNALLNE